MMSTTMFLGFFMLIVGIEFAYGHSDTPCVDYTREDWGARPTRHAEYMKIFPARMVFIHHNVKDRCYTVSECKKVTRAFQNYHMDTKKWDDVGCSFLVGEDGNIYEGRGWRRVGAHTKGYNDVSIGICVLGNFTATKPNQKAVDAMQRLLRCGVGNNTLISDYKLFGHADSRKAVVSVEVCPGKALYDIIKTWPRYDKDGPPPDSYWIQFITNSSPAPTKSNALYFALFCYCVFSGLNQLLTLPLN